jgi:hemerythrin-like metal-binding protein
MLNLREHSKLHHPVPHTSAGTFAKFEHQERLDGGYRNLYEEHRTCSRMLDNLDDVIIAGKSKSDLQDVVRRLFIAIWMHFRHEEELFAQYGFVDAPRHSALHSKILSNFLQLSDEIDRTALPAVWSNCGALIEQMLTQHITEEDALYAA